MGQMTEQERMVGIHAASKCSACRMFGWGSGHFPVLVNGFWHHPSCPTHRKSQAPTGIHVVVGTGNPKARQ